MKLRGVALVCCCAVLLFTLASCDRDFNFGQGNEDGVETIVYSEQVQPIFTQRCATSGCHDAETAADGLALDSWDSLVKGSNHGAMVIPYRPERSHLIFHINRDSMVVPVAEPQMPPDTLLSAGEVALLIQWVQQGAKNDFQRVPFPELRWGRVLVTSQAEDELGIIDAYANLLIRMVPVGELDNRLSPPEAPYNVTVGPLWRYYYVNLIGSNEIWKFDAISNEVTGKLNLGPQRSPAQVALSIDGTVGLVTNFDLSKTHRSVQVFDPQTMQVTDQVSDQRMMAPHGIRRVPNNDVYWVTCEQSDNIAIVRTTTEIGNIFLRVDPTVPEFPADEYQPKFGPYQTVFTSDGRFAYVTCRLSNEVRVFNAQTRELVKVIPVGVNPLVPDITPDDRFVYVANRGTSTAPSRTVSVINTATNTEIMKIQNVGAEPHGIAASRDGEYVYVSCENIDFPDAPHHPVSGMTMPGVVAVISTATNTVVRRIEVGAYAAGITFLPNR